MHADAAEALVAEIATSGQARGRWSHRAHQHY
jgi:hypothetical protein